MSTDRARLRELLAADPHEQRRTVEKLLASKNECSTDLHYRGTELIRTHEVLLDALPALLDALDEAEKALRARNVLDAGHVPVREDRPGIWIALYVLLTVGIVVVLAVFT